MLNLSTITFTSAALYLCHFPVVCNCKASCRVNAVHGHLYCCASNIVTMGTAGAGALLGLQHYTNVLRQIWYFFAKQKYLGICDVASAMCCYVQLLNSYKWITYVYCRHKWTDNLITFHTCTHHILWKDKNNTQIKLHTYNFNNMLT